MHKTCLAAKMAAWMSGRRSKVCIWRGDDGRYFWTAPYRDGRCPQQQGATLVAVRYPGHPWEQVA